MPFVECPARRPHDHALIILAILLLPTVIAVWAGRRKGRTGSWRTGGVVGLALAFLFFAMGHFVQTQAMVNMLPPLVPAREALVLATGVLEIVLAVGLLWPPTRRMAGVACIAVLILFFPANIYSALNATGMGGHQWGPVYLWIRAPLQIVLIGWAYVFVVRPSGSTRSNSAQEST